MMDSFNTPSRRYENNGGKHNDVGYYPTDRRYPRVVVHDVPETTQLGVHLQLGAVHLHK